MGAEWRELVLRPLAVHLVSLDARKHVLWGLNFRPYTTQARGNTASFRKERKDTEYPTLGVKNTLAKVRSRWMDCIPDRDDRGKRVN